MHLEQMLSVSEVAQVLNCSIYTIRRRLKCGALRGFHDGGSWKIPKSSYDEYISSRMVSSIPYISSHSEDIRNRKNDKKTKDSTPLYTSDGR
jgi:excisionase family DNA binding protein